MKITFVLFGAYGLGGTIRTVITTANALAERHDVEVCSVLRTAQEPFFAVDGRVRLVPLVDVRPEERHGGLPLGPLRRKLAGLPSRHYPRADYRWQRTNRLADLRLRRYLHGIEEGVVVGTRVGINLLVAQDVQRDVLTVGQEHLNLSAHGKRATAQMRRWYPQLDALVTLTSRDADDYGRLLAGAGTRVQAIPNAVPPTTEPRAALENPVIVAAGRLTPQKGFDLLIRAFAFVAPIHPTWSVRIFGDGREHDRLEKLIAGAGLAGRVQLRGRTDRLDAELADASMFVLSSRAEGLPLVMLEAMRAGLPVVSFDCPTGPADVLTDGVDGLLVPPGKPEALGATIRGLIEDADRRRRLASAAIRTAHRYSVPTVADEWEALLASL